MESGIGDYFRRAASLHQEIATQQVLDSSRCNGGFGPEGIGGDAVFAQLFRKTHDDHAHAILAHRISKVVSKPVGVHIQGWRQIQDMRVMGFFQVRDTGLAHKKSAAHIDAVHQLPALPFGLIGMRETDGAGVIDEYIDAAEGFRGGFYCLVDAFLEADIYLQG